MSAAKRREKWAKFEAQARELAARGISKRGNPLTNRGDGLTLKQRRNFYATRALVYNGGNWKKSNVRSVEYWQSHEKKGRKNPEGK